MFTNRAMTSLASSFDVIIRLRAGCSRAVQLPFERAFKLGVGHQICGKMPLASVPPSLLSHLVIVSIRQQEVLSNCQSPRIRSWQHLMR